MRKGEWRGFEGEGLECGKSVKLKDLSLSCGRDSDVKCAF